MEQRFCFSLDNFPRLAHMPLLGCPLADSQTQDIAVAKRRVGQKNSTGGVYPSQKLLVEFVELGLGPAIIQVKNVFLSGY